MMAGGGRKSGDHPLSAVHAIVPRCTASSFPRFPSYVAASEVAGIIKS